jgi:penicillin amidase
LLALLILTSACDDEATPMSSPDEQAPSRVDQLSAVLRVAARPSRHQALRFPAHVATDKDGIPHVFARSETDMVFLQGYLHARDRLFQMDVSRRRADGTLAELLGPGEGGTTLASDVMSRTIGLRRAAERSLAAASRDMRAALAAYAAGVNAYAGASPLPPEYAALEITRFRPWTEVDSVAIIESIAFSLSPFDDIDRTTRLLAYRAAGTRQGFDGTALFVDDTDRTAPFDPAATVPDALQAEPSRERTRQVDGMPAATDMSHLDPATVRLAEELMERVRREPWFQERQRNESDGGSNGWVVSGRLSVSGRPLLAGDPHLPLGAPATWYQVQLAASSAGIDVIGVSFPGVPYVIIGNNRRVAWTATSTQLDATDVYSERIELDATSPSGLSTVHDGRMEHIVPLPQSFLVNTRGDGVNDNLASASGPGIPEAVLIVPRRNQGPIVSIDVPNRTAISVQWAGSSGTRELDAFRGLNRARNIDEFEGALQNFDVGAQNFLYVDTRGNIAYFLAGEVPLREDLQAGSVAGLPPSFIRDGQGGNEWVRATSVDPTRAIPFEILPAAEMPRLVNPPRGFIVNSNNDPTGATRDNDAFNQLRPDGGIFYLGGAAFDMGARAVRVDDLLEDAIERKGRLRADDMKDIQADTVMNEARFFTPSILEAYDNARRAGSHEALAQAAADPRVAEAVGRLAAWDQSTPTGLREGFDASDEPGQLREPDAEEIAHSVAATIYAVWRNQFLRNTLVATLGRVEEGLPLSIRFRDRLGAARNLIDSFDEQQGVGASGLDFFEVPGIDDAATRRDLVILRSLSDALDLLAGQAYADAFQRSTDQDDYRWGRLHRVMLDNPVGGEFSIPPAGGAFPAPLGRSLPGIPVDGGVVSVDVANNMLLVDDPGAFVFRAGPSTRYVVRPRIGIGFESEASLPGGQSGIPGSPFYVNLLERWLTNETHPLRQSLAELAGNVVSLESFHPERR